MISPEVRKRYLPTIGIECHVQLRTKTKLFAAVANDARDAAPNTLVSHICLGMPGALPVLNEKVIEYASRAAFALNTEPQIYSIFERKHYFYPDLPKGYQISQLDKPIIVGGTVDIVVGGEAKKVRITRVQIEEDAGKSTHPAGKDYSLVDLNRAGTPLLEIVSEPDMHSAAEARAYAYELWLLMRYADVSDADLYHGNMRFDVNVSVGKTDELGTRSETKNLNSFRSVEKAIDYEIERQIEVLEKGGEVVQETRGWDDAKQKTFSQRTKEDAHDYRYFPDPDIPPIVLEEQYIKDIRGTMPKMPNEYRKLFTELGLDQSAADAVLADPRVSQFIESVLKQGNKDDARRIALWIVNVTSTESDSPEEQGEWVMSTANAIKLSCLVADKKLSSTAAKEVWLEMIKTNVNPETIARANDLLQVSDEGLIDEIVSQVLSDNPKAANDVKNGEMKAIGFLIGQIMKQSGGKANPGLAQQLIKKQLGL